MTTISDKHFALQKLKLNSTIIEQCSASLCADKEFMLKAVKVHWFCLKYASEQIKNDRDIVLEAAKSNHVNIEGNVRKMRELGQTMWISFIEDQEALQYAGSTIQDDKALVLKIVRNYGQYGMSLAYVSPRLQDDQEVVMEAVKRKGTLIRFASHRLKNDKAVALEALTNTPHAFGYFSEEIKTLCGKENPVAVLQAALFKEKMDAVLPQNSTMKNKVKI